MIAAVTQVAMAVVINNLISMRGFAGALLAWPGWTSSDGAAPNGRTMNKISHQTITNVSAAVKVSTAGPQACSNSSSVPLKSFG